MALTSSSGLGASTTTGVDGVAKITSWEDDVWGSILDGSDVSIHGCRELLLMRLPLSVATDCTIISLFVTSSATFHDMHRTHLRLP